MDPCDLCAACAKRQSLPGCFRLTVPWPVDRDGWDAASCSGFRPSV